MQIQSNGADGGIIALLPLLWVIVLMAAVAVSSIAQRREEITRMRVGIEVEVLRNDHADNAPNHAIATWLNMMRARYDDKYMDQYFATLKKRRSEYLRGRAKRRAEIRKQVPQEYRGNFYTIQNEGWSSGNTVSYTKVTTDGSLSNGGFEVVSHPLMDGEHHGWLATVGKLLRHITRIDRSCGLHVHIGLRDPNTGFGDDGQMSTHDAMSIAGRCAWAYAYFTDVFNQFVSASRHNGGYCQNGMQLRQRYGSATEFTEDRGREHIMVPTDEGAGIRYVPLDEDDASAGYWKYRTRTVTGDELYHKFYEYMTDMGRYYHCNLGSLLRRGFGTVEYRQHQGTSNPVKISNWIQLMYEFTTACASKSNFEAIEAYPQTREGLWAFLDLANDDPLVDYYTKRASVLRNEPLIRPCPSCGSHTCVHYECEGGNDPVIRSALSEIPSGRNTGWYCGGCDDPVRDVDYDDHTCYCEACGEHHDAYQFSGWATLGLSLLFMAPAVGAVALIVGCGIGAIHAGTKKFRAKNNLKRLFASLASRGGQASGYAWDGKNEDHVWHIKAPTSSKYLKERINKHINKSTTWTMLHTRFATHGKNNADNAHPHFGPEAHVTMVHNGVVHNHDDVWKGLGIKPTGPVDSQAVAAALEVGGIEKVVELCEGSMSLIWSDSRDPKGTLKFWSNGGNPLCAGRLDHPNTGHLVVASTLDILEKSQGSRLKTSWSCTVGREYTVCPNGYITHRDIEGSEDTAGYTYDWRTYSTLFGSGKSKSSKKRTIEVKQPKAGGDADNCAIVFTGKTKHYNYDDEDLNEALNEAWAYGSISGWAVWHSASGRGFDGYDGVHHQGIRAEDGTKYHLPSYVDGQAMDPQFNTEFQVQVLRGEFDPRPRVEEYDDTAEWINDPLQALGWYEDDDPRDHLHW